jgi:hypothetical protein
MIWLRLDKGQLALVLLSVGFLIGAIAVLLLPTPALPDAETRAAGNGAVAPFETPFPAVANDPASALVTGNPFDASRQPPAQRRTIMSSGNPEDGQPGTPFNFVLLGTVVIGNGRDIAVIQGNPAMPQGGTYHVGEEPVPGFKVTGITRDGATLVGQGQTIELKIRRPGDTNPRMNPQFGQQGNGQGYDEDMDDESDE